MNDLTTIFVFTDKAPERFADSQSNLIKFTIVAIVFIGFFLITRKRTKRIFSTSNLHLLLAVVSSGVLFSFGVIGYYSDRYVNQKLANLYATGQYQIAEGVVHVLHAQAGGCHDTSDIIQIDETQLEINYCSGSPGYTATIANGGVLTEGTYARVFYFSDYYNYEPTILRVDVKTSDK